MRVVYEEITTSLDDFSIFSLFKDEDEVIFLDSSMENENIGRYSIIVFNPFLSFKGKQGKLKIERDKKIEILEGSSFEKLRELLKEYSFANDTPLPFIAGAVGYLAYDLVSEVENISPKANDDLDLPDIYLNFYQGSIVIDKILNKVYVGHLENSECESFFEFVLEKIARGKSVKLNDEKLVKNQNIKANFSKPVYLQTIEKVRAYIKQGQISELNLTQRMECSLEKEPYEIYKKLRTSNVAPFSAFMELEGLAILSSSPERFIKVQDRKIETRPIKGTMRRGSSQEEDQQNKTFLKNSEKDKSENLMIVDLVRSELSKICKKKTVKVQDLFKIEEYPSVFQLVSTVAGELKDEVDLVDCLQACFPGGSITGAPKIRSMEIIDELEPNTRNIYTGSIGYLGYDGNLDLNVVIRTIVIKEDKAYFGVGGAITWDSNAEDEYRETLDKAHALMRVL